MKLGLLYLNVAKISCTLLIWEILEPESRWNPASVIEDRSGCPPRMEKKAGVGYFFLLSAIYAERGDRYDVFPGRPFVDS